MNINHFNTDKLTVVSGERLWLEGNAVLQAKAVSLLEGVEFAVAMPDLHAGKTPVGITVVTQNILYPHLIGTDIGCGMSTYATGIGVKKIKPERWSSRLNTIKALSALPNRSFFEDCPIPDFGSIGSGNHFAEFGAVHEIYNQDLLNEIGIDADETLLTVHSGSRSYGSRILSEFPDYNGYPADGAQAAAYLKKHDDALLWASKNREEAAYKLIDYLGFAPALVKKLESFHNFLEGADGKFYHRKGSVSAKIGAVLIAGSRGTLSYLVRPTPKCADFGCSLAHGSGRKWARSMCKSRVRQKYDNASIKQNRYKGLLVCHDYDLWFEEAPEAYKNIETVIAVLLDYGLIELIASVRPVLTFKG